MRGAVIRGIDPAEEPDVTPLAAQLKDGALAKLVPGGWGVLLGGEMARSLGVRVGDPITVVTPGNSRALEASRTQNEPVRTASG